MSEIKARFCVMANVNLVASFMFAFDAMLDPEKSNAVQKAGGKAHEAIPAFEEIVQPAMAAIADEVIGEALDAVLKKPEFQKDVRGVCPAAPGDTLRVFARGERQRRRAEREYRGRHQSLHRVQRRGGGA
jgi:hypothetical protein